ncbi:hypothetical protein F4808DRAFT_432774 [Astrocystis sublimbata]|nr:hypothetical protein F4808DRAFT_432774 [Astrocystis sublimbata]
MEFTEVAKPCLVCRRATKQQCSRCHDAAYCSKECQKSDFKVHKLVCYQYAYVMATERPANGEKLAIFFDVEHSGPDLSWYQPSEVLNLTMEIWKELGEDENGKLYTTPLRRDPPNVIFLACQVSDVDISVFTPNESTRQIVATNTQPTPLWRGPVFAWGRVDYRMPATDGFRDLDMEDLRHVFHFIRTMEQVVRRRETSFGPVGVIRQHTGAPI